MSISKVVQEIQYILAPAVMVSSAALLLLGLQNKFSSLANRFRGLNQERQHLAEKEEKSREEEARLSNIKEQGAYLFLRISYIKNAVLLTYASIGCFTGSSVLILTNLYFSLNLYWLIIAVFSTGLLLLFVMVIIMFFDTFFLYRVMKLEKKSWHSTVKK